MTIVMGLDQHRGQITAEWIAQPLGGLGGDDDALALMPEPPADLPDTLDRVIARHQHAERVAVLRTLKPRERRELYLKALGCGYKEIAQRTGSTYTAVNWRISEGRAQLRKLARRRRQREDPTDDTASGARDAF